MTSEYGISVLVMNILLFLRLNTQSLVSTETSTTTLSSRLLLTLGLNYKLNRSQLLLLSVVSALVSLSSSRPQHHGLTIYG